MYNIQTILPTDVDALMIEDNKDLVTLVTCTPYGVNTHRLLVMGERVPYDDSKVDEKGLVTAEKHAVIIDPSVWVLVGFALFLVIFVAVSGIRKRMEKNKGQQEDKITDERRR